MAPPSLKLTYFDTSGRAEPIRLALLLGDIPFEDVRISRPEWLEQKEKAPLGQVPILEVNGKIFPQSNALLRYAGKLAGLAPEDPVQQLAIDVYMDTLDEATGAMVLAIRETDEEKKKAILGKVFSETFPHLLGGMCAMIKESQAEPGFAVGSSVSIFDLRIFTTVDTFRSGRWGLPTNALDPFPALIAIHDKVASNPKVAEYYASKK
eukprot:TRINITY_DN4099_c0_g1_i1.p1 TRINITY_DN4099_c0_g1~~TRINITY_DN4099_c0_g1_i1.p1  ORF type:complete len:208 (-),score=45.31 TRINITY_DN4099_c0_g1_i1:792-1415(-)